MHPDRSTRREFLRTAATTAGLAVPHIISASALGCATRVAPSDRITLGCIGTGGMGTYDMSLFLQLPEVQLVALCDVKQAARERALQAAIAAGAGQGIAQYVDFRELIDRPDIDVVSVASNDHWHVLHALAAVRAGKDVYVEKPLGISIQQICTLRDEVHRYGRMFQFGTQQRSMPQFHQACELVLNGRIGELHTMRVSAPSGFAERTGEAGYPIMPPPDDVDYELWLGPAPWAPYTPKRIVSPHWFHISTYALGYIAGWGIHHVDIAQWGNGSQLTGPVEIEGSGLFPTDDGLCDTALNWDVDMTYANGVRLSFTSDGGKKPSRHTLRRDRRLDPCGPQPDRGGTDIRSSRAHRARRDPLAGQSSPSSKLDRGGQDAPADDLPDRRGRTVGHDLPSRRYRHAAGTQAPLGPGEGRVRGRRSGQRHDHSGHAEPLAPIGSTGR